MDIYRVYARMDKSIFFLILIFLTTREKYNKINREMCHFSLNFFGICLVSSKLYANVNIILAITGKI